MLSPSSPLALSLSLLFVVCLFALRNGPTAETPQFELASRIIIAMSLFGFCTREHRLTKAKTEMLHRPENYNFRLAYRRKTFTATGDDRIEWKPAYADLPSNANIWRRDAAFEWSLHATLRFLRAKQQSNPPEYSEQWFTVFNIQRFIAFYNVAIAGIYLLQQCAAYRVLTNYAWYFACKM